MELKAERPEVILLIRVGDFFEAYGEDATRIAEALEITLTGRDVNGREERLPMAGVPYHALDRYLARLVQQGHKVGHKTHVQLVQQRIFQPNHFALL